jgi:hypothetical protein
MSGTSAVGLPFTTSSSYVVPGFARASSSSTVSANTLSAWLPLIARPLTKNTGVPVMPSAVASLTSAAICAAYWRVSSAWRKRSMSSPSSRAMSSTAARSTLPCTT